MNNILRNSWNNQLYFTNKTNPVRNVPHTNPSHTNNCTHYLVIVCKYHRSYMGYLYTGLYLSHNSHLENSSKLVLHKILTLIRIKKLFLFYFFALYLNLITSYGVGFISFTKYIYNKREIVLLFFYILITLNTYQYVLHHKHSNYQLYYQKLHIFLFHMNLFHKHRNRPVLF